MNIDYLKTIVRNLKAIKNADPLQEPQKEPEKEPAPAAQEPGQEEELSAIKEAVRVLQEAVAELQEKLLESMAKEAESSEVANRLTAGLRNRAGSSTSGPAAATFQDALRKFRDAHPTMRYAEAYAAVARQNPSLYKAMLKG